LATLIAGFVIAKIMRYGVARPRPVVGGYKLGVEAKKIGKAREGMA
jgi:hypothetical protein